MSNELIIDVTSSEIVIALLKDKQLVELNKERSNNKFSVGDIFLAKAKKIIPGLNAAFIDVGYERDAFLHYLDLGPQFSTLKHVVENMNKEKPLSIKRIKALPDISKHGKITEVISPGDKIVVQVAKEPISTKGPRLTSEISIAGRNIVLIPFANKISVSQKIDSKEEKKRLKKLMQSICPKNYGIIVRTAAKGKRVAELDNELKGLVEKWENALRKIRASKPPKLIVGEVNRTTAIVRDMLNSDFNSIYINDRAVYTDLKNYIADIAPEKLNVLKYHNGNQPIFQHYGIDRQIKALFGKTITMKTGAYLIIEHTEALHAIDVNSGNRSKKGMDQEENALQTNLLAAGEIVRQLRLRDMGGIIVIDFIDMVKRENRAKLYEHMRSLMGEDPTKHTILPLSKFGLMQITRQRVRPEMHIMTAEKCPACGGTGEVTPSILVTDQIENHLRYIIETINRTKITIVTHPFIAAYLNEGFISTVLKWNLKYRRRIKVLASENFHMLEYHFHDKSNEEIIV